jgi:hypothetical protein
MIPGRLLKTPKEDKRNDKTIRKIRIKPDSPVNVNHLSGSKRKHYPP